MLSKVMTIRGSLRLAHVVEGTEGLSTVRISFSNVSQCKLPKNIHLNETTVFELDCCVKIIDDGRKALNRFLQCLNEFVLAKTEAGLHLKGSILITLETEADPVNIRVSVKDGKVTHQQARLVWDAEEVVI